MKYFSPEIIQTVKEIRDSGGRITVMTGAGISAESGIPTFRGPDGYWTIGSANYRPTEMATNNMFRQNPREVWKWYVYRRSICNAAEPNAGHHAVVQMEKSLGDQFHLVTQNVDGLHLRAGNSEEKTYQIHGSLAFIRCWDECSPELFRFPEGIANKEKGDDLTDDEWNLLVCPKCGKMARPHVLWFDEYYNENYYRFESSLQLASESKLLITVGTSGSTNLPNQVAGMVYNQGGKIMDINIEANTFSEYASISGGWFIQGPGAEVLPELAEILA